MLQCRWRVCNVPLMQIIEGHAAASAAAATAWPSMCCISGVHWKHPAISKHAACSGLCMLQYQPPCQQAPPFDLQDQAFRVDSCATFHPSLMQWQHNLRVCLCKISYCCAVCAVNITINVMSTCFINLDKTVVDSLIYL